MSVYLIIKVYLLCRVEDYYFKYINEITLQNFFLFSSRALHVYSNMQFLFRQLLLELPIAAVWFSLKPKQLEKHVGELRSQYKEARTKASGGDINSHTPSLSLSKHHNAW